MNWNAIWPVMTLALGWFLGELSGMLKSRSVRREELRLTIFRIFTLLDDIDLFLYLCNQMPLDAVMVASTQRAEDVREQLFLRWSNQQELIQSKMDTVITPIARFDPILAYKLHGALVTVRSLSMPKISEGQSTLTNGEIIAFNTMRQTLSVELQQELERMLEQLASKVGPFTTKRVRSLLQGRTGTEGFHRADEVMTKIKEAVERENER